MFPRSANLIKVRFTGIDIPVIKRNQFNKAEQIKTFEFVI